MKKIQIMIIMVTIELVSLFAQNEVSPFSYDIAKETESTLIRVYITWKNDGTDSIEDTNLGISGGNLITDVHLKFEQLTNITPP